MDPLGFALENFDFIGQWRDAEAGAPVDAHGVFVDGSTLEGPAGLRQVLLTHSELFVQTFAEKLLTYALGRPLEAERHAGRARDRAARGARRLPVVGARARRRDKRADADAQQAPAAGSRRRARRIEGYAMFVTKKHLSRRTLLRGAGAAIALPLLDSMIPAATALAQTAATA